MKTSLSTIRRMLAAVLSGLALTGPAAATTLYDSGGFESPVFLLEENLDGQDPAPLGNGPWARDQGSSMAVVTAVNAIDGNKSVKITRAAGATGNTRWGVVKPVTPAGHDNVVEIRFDMKVIQKASEYGPLFGVEAYDGSAGTPKLIGSLLLDAGNGEIVCHQAGTGAFLGTGFHPDLARHHHYRLSLNFTDATCLLHVDGQLVHTEGFTDPTAIAFTDAPLATLAAGTDAEEGIAYLDNYRITQTTSELPHLLWRGDGSGNVWDLGQTANWFDGISPVGFANGKAVLFDDSGSSDPAVRLQGILAPASVRIDAAQNYEFSGPGSIDGTAGLLKSGGGTLTISNANTYSGDTTLTAGVLSIRNSSGSATGTGTVTVAAMGTLTGDGNIGGPVEVAPGGVIAPGEGVGTLNIGSSLVLDDAHLKYDLGSSSDQLAISGDLVLSGSIDITDAGGFGPGSYALMTYGGELTEASLAISSAPDSYAYSIDTTTPGIVSLVVSLPPPAPAAPDGLVATPTGTHSITLDWVDRSDNEDSFSLERSVGGGNFALIASVGADQTTFSDSGLSPGTTYSYRVKAANSGGESAYSNVASATTETSPAVAHYEFESNTLDSSGNNHHGIPVGTILYEVGHVGDYAASFDGNSFVETAKLVDSSFTVMMWVKTTANASGSTSTWLEGMGLVDGETPTNTTDWGCSITNSKFVFGVGAPTTTVVSNRSVNDGAWHHIAATRDNNSGEVRVYIDGTLDAVGAAPAGIRERTTQLRIGATQTAQPIFYVGAMDDLRFYGSVLNASEIARIGYTPGPPPPPSEGPLTIHPLGDSITWGYTTASAADSPGGYREPLYRNLLLNGAPAVRFVGANTSNPGPLLTRDNQTGHDGYPQYTITEISNNLDANVPTGKTRGNNGGYWLTGGGVRPPLDPDMILLLAGTNDIEEGADAPLIESRMNAMVGRIFSLRPETTIYLASIPPYPADAAKTATAKAYNRLLIERTMPKYLAAGYNIRFVDQYPNFVAGTGPNGDVVIASLYGDTIHPNEAGYQLMGDTWAAAILAEPGPVPASPTGLVAAGVTEDGITLEWSDQSSNEGAFVIQRTRDGVNFETIGYVGPDVTRFTDTSVGGGITYGYRVVARNSDGEAVSNYLTVTAVGGGGLIAYLKLDETSGTTAFDSSPNANDGTLHGDPVRIAGKLGNALDFDGVNDYLTFREGFVQQLNDFTVASWVKLDALDNWARVFDFGTDTTNYMFLTPKSSTKGKMRFAIRTPNSGGEQGIDATVAMPVGEWVHVAVTLNGSTARLYLNGEVVGSNDSLTLTPASLGSTTRNYIGKSQWNDPLLDGAIDDFQVHDRALGPDEIMTLVELTDPVVIPSAPTGLVVVESDSQAGLSWSRVDGADSYSVYRSEGGGFVLIASGLTDPIYTDAGLANGTTYSYVVTALSAAGESGFSDAREATPFPEADYGGRAMVASVQALGVNLPIADTGSLPPAGGSREASLLSFNELNVVAGEIGHAFTIGQADRTRSEASAANLVIDANGIPIKAGFVMARALAVYQAGGTTALAGGAEIGNLVVAGVPVTVTGEPNQVVNLLTGQLVLNERIVTDTSITVNALRLSLTGGDGLVVASAYAEYASAELPPPLGEDRISGGGWIADDSGERIGNFGLSAGYEEGVPSGHLTYRDHGSGMKVEATGITSYTQGPTANSRRIEGSAEIDGVSGFTFTVVAEDNGEPGDADTFSIDLSNGYHADGLLGGGNIQLHLPGK